MAYPSQAGSELTPSVTLQNRRSGVRVPPPLMRRPWKQGFFFAPVLSTSVTSYLTSYLSAPHALARGLPIVQRVDRLAPVMAVMAGLGRAGQVRRPHPEDRIPSWLVAERAAEREQ